MTPAPHDALAADGAVLRIRPAGPQDRDGLARIFASRSARNLRQRFATSDQTPDQHGIEAEIARLTRPADERHAAVVAEQRGRLLAFASYESLEASPGRDDVVDIAVLVDDGEHERGIGTLLLEELAAIARRRGVSTLHGDVLAGNASMIQMITALGTPVRVRRRGDVIGIDVSTAIDTGSADALELRDVQAEHHSLAPLFRPRVVAVVGAGRSPNGVGRTVLRNLVAGGFTGAVHPVNPAATPAEGRTAYASVSAIPQPVDLAVVAVPATAVAPVLEDCGGAGVRAVVVLSSGFSEEGASGRAAQAELVRTARRHGMRLVGPNCLGVLTTDADVRLDATFASVRPPRGGLAVASQSGAVGITLLDHAARQGAGLSAFVSLGNKADVSGNDLLSYWYDDPGTRAVALYLESVGNARRFARIARAVGRRKPILAIKSGRTAAGTRAGASHTAAAAAPDAVVDALFAQAGVIRCDGLGELLDAARLLIDQPVPAGPRIAVIGNAGGINVLAADAADVNGLLVPEFGARAQREIAQAAPGAANVTNPVDLGAAASPSAMSTALRAAAADGGVDAVLAVFVATQANDVPGTLDALAEAADAVPVPIAFVLLGVPDTPTSLGSRRHAPVYQMPEYAVSALAHAARYAAWRARPLSEPPALAHVEAPGARAVVRSALAQGGGWQPPEPATELLRAYGIPVLDGVVAQGAPSVVAAAERTGYPVVLKAADPAVVHKSDLAAVQLGLSNAEAVRAGYAAICAGLGDSDPAVLVQRQVPAGIELMAGIVHDPTFGSLVVVGSGGVQADVLADRALRLTPVTAPDAAEMWRSLRMARLLTGYRGAPPVDTAALEDLLLRLGRLAADLPEVAELDLNPVIANPSGLIAVDVKLRLHEVGAELDAGVRSLREPGTPPSFTAG